MVLEDKEAWINDDEKHSLSAGFDSPVICDGRNFQMFFLST